MDKLTIFFSTLLDLWLDTAFWLIIGLIIAGLLKNLFNNKTLAKQLSGKGFWPVIKAAILGIPLPLCSCGVIPVAIGLRRAGASKSATTAFLISTPETGVDSISISYALLGPFMAIIRPIAATVSAIVAAILVQMTDVEKKEEQIKLRKLQLSPIQLNHNCCSDDCCENPSSLLPEKEISWLQKLWQSQCFAFGELIEDLSFWLIGGLIMSALIVTFIPNEMLAEISQGPLAMLIMAIIGVPIYICASASTPLAAGLMMAGVSPGAVLVFLLAGPATNLATLGIIYKEMGKRTLASYLIGVIGIAISFGYLTNFLTKYLSINIQAELANSDQLLPSIISWLSGIFLLVIIIYDLWKRIKRKPKHIGCCTGCSCHE